MSSLRFLAPALLLALAAPAAAQTLPDLDRRVRTLEGDMRQVKRRVLPDRDSRLIEPELAPEPAAASPGAAADAPVAVLTERVDALERQQRALTQQLEEQGFRLRQLEETARKTREEFEFRVGKLETPTSVAPPAPSNTPPAAAATPDEPDLAAAVPAPAAPRGPEGEYLAAYEFVKAKDWARAEAALTTFIAAHPKHRRTSHARYWLGRTHYSQGQYETSARVHFDNYKASARGERAQESLYWVGQSLTRLKRDTQACQVYELAAKVYAEDMKPELRPQFTSARASAGCA